MNARRTVFLACTALVALGLPSPAYAGKPLPPVFSVTGVSMIEAFGPALVQVTRTGNLKKTASVLLTRVPSDLGNATGFFEFSTETELVSFARNESSRYVSVNAIDDTDVEGDETYRVMLSNPSTGTVGPPAYVTVVDDDQPGTFAVAPGATLNAANVRLSGCDTLVAFLVDADDGIMSSVLDNTAATCDVLGAIQYAITNFTWTNATAGTVTVRFVLYDDTCGIAYFADGVSSVGAIDRAASWGSTAAGVPYGTAINDGGGCGLAALSDNQPNTATPGNLQVSGITVVAPA